MTHGMKLSYRIFGITLLIAVVALTGVAVLITTQMTGMLRTESLRRIADNVNRETRVLENSLDMLKGDVTFLAATEAAAIFSRVGTRPLSGQEAAQLEQARAWMAQTFQAVMLRRPAYTQIRFVGVANDGREIVRVNRDGDRVVVVPDAELQRKGDRYYFNELLDGAPGSIYVSKVDLNREQGRIAEPHQAVFRVGTPVFSPSGRPVGAIIVNLDFNAFLSDVSPAPDLRVFITNEDGDYLVHPDPSRRFGFEFGRPMRLPEDMGLADRWGEIVSGAPMATYMASPKAGLVIDRVELGDTGPGRPPHYLVFAAVASMAELEAQAGAFHRMVVISAVAMGVLLALALAFATHRLTQPIARLTASADRIAAGEENVDLASATRTDEIGRLAKALQRMLDALNDAANSQQLAAMGRMASMVAHDLRNALSSVKMNTQILARRHSGLEDVDAPHCRIALDQIHYMEHILTDMLAFARGDELKIAPVDIAEPISAAIIAELPHMEEKRVTVSLDNVRGLPAVRGDQVKLTQVFQNLLDNAIQASPDGGNIRIAAQMTVPGRVEISVYDEGAGIPADLQDKVREPFFTTRAKGTGLGLAIVDRLIKQHGGTLVIGAGPGGRVTVCLPIGEIPAQGWT